MLRFLSINTPTIGLTIKRTPLWSIEIDERTVAHFRDRKLANMNVFKKGIKYLAPRQRIQFFFAVMHENFEKLIEKPIDIKATYTDALGNKYENMFSIDLSELVGMMEPEKSPLSKIADHLGKIKDVLKKKSA